MLHRKVVAVSLQAEVILVLGAARAQSLQMVLHDADLAVRLG